MKIDFSSLVATAEFSKFAGILSAALSQHLDLNYECDSQRGPIYPSDIVSKSVKACNSWSRLIPFLVWRAGTISEVLLLLFQCSSLQGGCDCHC